MKKSEYNNIKKSCNRNKFIMFVQTIGGSFILLFF